MPCTRYGVAHGVVRDGDAAGDQRLQAVQLHVALHLRLEVGAAGLEGGLDEVHVCVVADVVAVGKEILAERAGLQLAAQIFVADLQAHAVGLVLQDGSLHQDLPGTLRHVGHQKVRQALLLQLSLRQAD